MKGTDPDVMRKKLEERDRTFKECEPEPEAWPDGDIRKALRTRSDWKGMLVTVWAELPDNQEYPLPGQLVRVYNRESGGSYWISVEGRKEPARCRGVRIRSLRAGGEVYRAVLQALGEMELDTQDQKSSSPESKERLEARALAERKRQLNTLEFLVDMGHLSPADLDYWREAPISMPSTGQQRTPPSKQNRYVLEVVIAYLEGLNLVLSKDGANSAFKMAAERIGSISESSVARYWAKWKQEQ